MIQEVVTDPKRQEAVVENFCSETMYGSSERVLNEAKKKRGYGSDFNNLCFKGDDWNEEYQEYLYPYPVDEAHAIVTEANYDLSADDDIEKIAYVTFPVLYKHFSETVDREIQDGYSKNPQRLRELLAETKITLGLDDQTQ